MQEGPVSIFSNGFNPKTWVSKSPLQQIVSAVDTALAPNDRDNERIKLYKDGWNRVLDPILTSIDEIYSERITDKTSDRQLFDDVFHSKYTKYGPRMPLGEACNKNFYGLVESMISCIRQSHKFIQRGGSNHWLWPYQMNFAEDFEKLVELLGEYSMEEIEVTDNNGKIYKKKRVKEHLVEELKNVVHDVKDRVDLPKSGGWKKVSHRQSKDKRGPNKKKSNQRKEPGKIIPKSKKKIPIEPESKSEPIDDLIDSLYDGPEESGDLPLRLSKDFPEGAILADDKVLVPKEEGDTTTYVVWNNQ